MKFLSAGLLELRVEFEECERTVQIAWPQFKLSSRRD